MGRRIKTAAIHRARLADSGGLGGASVNRDAANQRSPTSCQHYYRDHQVQAPGRKRRESKSVAKTRSTPAVANAAKPAASQREERVTKRVHADGVE